MRTLLFSLAHPDDESFSGAGLASWCLARGVRVVLVCATRGEAGKAGAAHVSGAPADVGAAREQELREAARIIGIDTIHFLGYRDRALGDADPAVVRGQLVGFLRQYTPDIVVTFDPNGFNRHPDHLAISGFTMDAVAAAGDPRWLPDLGPAHNVRRVLWTPPLGPWDVARSSNVRGEPGIDFLIDISPWSERKAAALRAHRTQHEAVDSRFFNQPDVDRILAAEAYRQGFGPPLTARPSTNPFDGIDASIN